MQIKYLFLCEFIYSLTRVFSQGMAAGTSISYHGGPVLSKTSSMYIIYYGDWSLNSKNIINNFVSGFSGSNYYNIERNYLFGGDGNINLIQTIQDNYSVGKTISSPFDIINYHIFKGNIPNDPNAIYSILTYKDVFLYGFCSQFCGFHGSSNGFLMLWVGDSVQCGGGCGSTQNGISINNDSDADLSINILAHEIVETVSDPFLNAWFDDNGNENADKCSWNFGTSYTESNGAKWNIQTSTGKYQIQTNWDPITQQCLNSINNNVQSSTLTIYTSTIDTLTTDTSSSLTDTLTTDTSTYTLTSTDTLTTNTLTLTDTSSASTYTLTDTVTLTIYTSSALTDTLGTLTDTLSTLTTIDTNIPISINLPISTNIISSSKSNKQLIFKLYFYIIFILI